MKLLEQLEQSPEIAKQCVLKLIVVMAIIPIIQQALPVYELSGINLV